MFHCTDKYTPSEALKAHWYKYVTSICKAAGQDISSDHIAALLLKDHAYQQDSPITQLVTHMYEYTPKKDSAGI